MRGENKDFGGTSDGSRKMSSPHDDQRLRKAFQDLHKQYQRDLPPFDDLWKRSNSASLKRRRSRIQLRRLLRAGATVAAALVLYWAVRPRDFINPGKEPQLTEWRAPTDFLLETPGRKLLGEVPMIPSPDAAEAIQSLRQSSQEKKP